MYLRKIINISAEDSPNVKLARVELGLGKQPSNRILVPGVLSWKEYQRRLQMWDDIRQSVGLRGQFYKGAEILLYPPEWLDLAARKITQARPYGRVTMGVDSAQGGDNTAWAVTDTIGLLDLISKKTPDTSVIVPETLALKDRWNVKPEDILFDAGGGGKPHGDRMRRMGYAVRIIPFGASATDAGLYRRMKTHRERAEERESKYVYKNRRAEMYGILRTLLNPAIVGTDGVGLMEGPFSLPAELMNKPRGDGGPTLRKQLEPLPLYYDGEGRMYLPPKTKPHKDYQGETLMDIVGCSPDESDALVLAVYGQMVHPTKIIIRR